MGRLIDLDKVEFLKVDGNIEFNHGVDCCINRLLKQPLVEAIPKDQYEQRLKENNELINDLEELRTMINKFAESYEKRLKADMVAMLTEIQLEIEEIEKFTNTIGWELRAKTPEEIKEECSEIIQQKINALKENKGSE